MSNLRWTYQVRLTEQVLIQVDSGGLFSVDRHRTSRSEKLTKVAHCHCILFCSIPNPCRERLKIFYLLCEAKKMSPVKL